MRKKIFWPWSLGLTVTMLAAPLALAQERTTCRDLDKIIQSVADEPCEAVVDEAERCFDKLNERYAVVKQFPGKSREDRLKAVAALRKDYETALRTMGGYSKYLKGAGDNACVDQAGALDIWIEEVQLDLNDLKKPGF